MLPAGVSPVGGRRPDLNPRQRLERPLSLTTRLRERHGPVAGCLFEPFELGRLPERDRLGGRGVRFDHDGRTVGQDLGHHLAHLGRVESGRYDGVRT